jgi:type IV secretory pathway VirJ component
MRRRVITPPLMALILAALVASGAAPRGGDTASITIRGRTQTLHLSGPADGRPCIVSSGDGGWIHLAPRIAEVLAGRGYFVVGFDTRAYLAGFTSRTGVLSPDQVPGDYGVLTSFASARTGRKPLLVGVSEGGGLSVLAAADPSIKAAVAGVIGVGLGDLNELGWRWRDALIYVTKGKADEPSFSVAGTIERVSPLPVVALNATHDEFVPLAEVQAVMARAREPKQLRLVPASDHRFSDAAAQFDEALIDAIRWVDAHAK